MKPPAWSYSSITLFQQCPKKYHHLRIVKDFVEPKTEQLLYGEQLHKAAEEFVRDGTPLPEQFLFILPYLKKLNAVKGDKLCEHKMGITDGGKPCDFSDKHVWWRGIADFLAVDGREAVLVDYKTGKSAKYADPKQLDVMAGALFVHYPELKTIKSALAFVVSNDFIPKVHAAKQRDEYLATFHDELDRLEHAELSGVWNPKSGPLCGWCPVVECEHHRPRRR